MNGPSIHRIERLNYVLAAVAALISLVTQSQAIALGVCVGAALTCVNFYVLRRLIVKWTSDAAKGQPGNAPMLMLPKMVAMMGLVAVAILFLPINVVAFTIGYSIFILSIIVETIYSTLRAAPEEAGSTESDHG